jgi:hypothetical protein
MSTLHVHMDESGDLDFTSRGSTYYVFAVVWTYDPLPLALSLQQLRVTMLKEGQRESSQLEKFRASADSYAIRRRVTNAMLKLSSWKFSAAVIQKNKVTPKEYEYPGSFYSRFATVPLRFLFRSPIIEHAHNLLIYTDRFPQQCHRQFTEKAIKKACHRELGESVPFHIYHHASSSNSWLQVADYLAYAVGRKWEHNNLDIYDLFRNRLAKVEHDVLHSERQFYY